MVAQVEAAGLQVLVQGTPNTRVAVVGVQVMAGGVSNALVEVVGLQVMAAGSGFALLKPTANSASSAAAGSPSANLHDNNSATWWAGSAPGNQTVTATLPAAQVVDYYSLTARPDTPTAAPNSWSFEGSTDGVTWTVIDSKVGQVFSAAQTKHYQLNNTTPYTQFRLVVTQNGDTSIATSFSDWRLGQWTGTAPASGGKPDPPPPYGPAPAVAASDTFTSPVRIFGTTYAGGDPIPATFTPRLLRWLAKRGYITPAGSLTVKRPVKVDGTAYAAGTTWAASVVPAVAKKLLRGRYIGK